jgi:hypothetical protein
MSFICKVCGPVANGEKQTKIPTKLREVEYNLQVKTIYADGEALKTVRKAHGTEIVEEASYCTKHLPIVIEPIKVEKVTRDQLIKTIMMIRRNNDEDAEEERDNSKRHNHTKDKKEE